MCKFCEDSEPLIDTGNLSVQNIKVVIAKNILEADSTYNDAYGKETVTKACRINYCPVCGKELKGARR